LGAFDVALIPFRLSPLTQAVNPVKLFEYAAAGVPIVATSTDELMRYASWCTLADSSEAFVEAALRLAHAPLQDEQSRQAALKDVRLNDWQARLEEIERLLQAL
jgi:glycosyltransferase involved in cell wall biosynthesis